MKNQLSREERMRLMRFVCSFAWADLEVKESERRFVASLVNRLDLDEDEIEAVQGWLASPPDPEDVDPMEIPIEHRKIFLDTVLAMTAADGELDPKEAESYNLLSQLVR